MVLAFIVGFCFSIFADMPIRDPGISSGEMAVYGVQVEGEYSQLIERVFIREDEGVDYYEIVSESDEETTTVNIDRSTMLPFYINTVTRSPRFTSEESTIITLQPGFDYDVIMILGFNELAYLLRGYPFEAEPTIGVDFLMSAGEDNGVFDFDIFVRFIDIETLSVGEKQVECYKLELRFRASGIMRVLNGMMPKTYFWYSVEPPHILIAYEGSSGPPGAPKRYVKIEDYSGWD